MVNWFNLFYHMQHHRKLAQNPDKRLRQYKKCYSHKNHHYTGDSKGRESLVKDAYSYYEGSHRLKSPENSGSRRSYVMNSHSHCQQRNHRRK